MNSRSIRRLTHATALVRFLLIASLVWSSLPSTTTWAALGLPPTLSDAIATVLPFSLGIPNGANPAANDKPLFAPSMSATKRDALANDLDGDGLADAGDTIRYTVVIRNTGSDATSVTFSDTLDPNTTLSGTVRTTPIALDDSFSAIGNVSINIVAGSGVLANDFGLPPPSALAFTGLSAQGGNVTMNADGSFTYNPPAGYEGVDTFVYTATNASGINTATVTINVSGMIWFINNAAGAGDGRLSSPFNALTAFNAINNGVGNNPAPNDNIFVYESAVAYTGGITLTSGQRLIGQDSTASLSALTGLTPPSGSAPLPTMNSGGNAAIIQNAAGNAVALGSNNYLYGFSIVATSADAITGTNFGTLTVGDVIITTAGRALNLANGSANGSFTNITSSSGANNINLSNVNSTGLYLGTGALSGATGTAFNLSGGNGTFTYDGTVSKTSVGPIVNIQSRTGGSVTLNGALSCGSSCTGLNVSGNSGGSITFSSGSKSFSTGTNTAINLSSNTGATINFTNGGLSINTTSGNGFNATGDGTINVTGAGNTINSTTGVALNVQNTTIGASGLTFRSISANGGANGIVLINTGTSGGLTVVGTGTADSGGVIQNTTGSSILVTNTQNLSLTRMRISNPSTFGIEANGLSGNFNRLDNSVIEGFNGTNGGGYQIINTNVNLGNLIVTNSTFQNSTAGNALRLETAGTTNATLLVEGNSLFTNIFGDGVQVNTLTGSTGVINVTIQNSNFNNANTNGNGGITLGAFGGPVIYNFDVNNNNLNTLMRPLSTQGVINFTNGDLDGGGPTVIGFIRNNTINNILQGRGITAVADTFSGPTRITIDNNTLNTFGDNKWPIYVSARNSADVDVFVTNNRVGNSGTLFTVDSNSEAVFLQTQNGARLDALVQGNDITANTNFEALRAQAQATSLLNATFINNTVADTLGTRNEIDFTILNSATSAVMCVNVSGNNVGGSAGNIDLAEGTGASVALNVVQANAAAVATANGGATVTSGGTPQFGQSACTLPTAMLPLTNNRGVASQQTGKPSDDAAHVMTAQADDGLQVTAVAQAISLTDLSITPSGAWTAWQPLQTDIAPTTHDTTIAGISTHNTTYTSVASVAAAPLSIGAPINIGTLPAGKIITITFDAVITNPLPIGVTSISNQGQVSGSNFATLPTDDPDTGAPNDATVTALDIKADLQITKTVSSASVIPGQLLTYTLNYRNNGPQGAANVVITDLLPITLTNPSFQSSALITPTAPFSYAWNIGSLLANASGSITVTGIVSNVRASAFTNTATITSTIPDTNTLNNTSSVVVNVQNVAPVAVDDTPTTFEDTPATFTLLSNDSDLNNDPLTITAVGAAGNGLVTINGATVRYTPTLNFNGTDVFTYTISDGNLFATGLVTVMVTPVNDPPIAAVGANQTVFVATSVALAGSASSDVDGPFPLSYGWTQIGGPAVSFNPTLSVTTFTAPATPAVLTFTLVVSDAANLASAPITTVITVTDTPITNLSALNSSPTTLGNSTAFTATASGSNIVYTWNFGDGSAAANGANVNRTYAAVGTYTATVTATNSISTVVATTLVTITNVAPTANAGVDQTVFVSTLVTLDGTSSNDPDGHTPLSYRWTQTGGTTVSLSSASAAQPTFTAPTTPTVLTFSLIVTDARGLVAAAADSVVITVTDTPITNLSALNSSPTFIGFATFFSATATGSNIVYTWNFGDGSATANGANANRTYAAVGTYTATVTATNSVSTVVATTRVTVNNPAITNLIASNSSPTTLGNSTNFSATASGINIVYSWNFGDGSPIVSGANVSRTYAAVGTYTARVTATNGISTVVATTLVTITDTPIAALVASNSSPTTLGNATFFTATASGSNIVYSWNFGDGSPIVSGANVSRTYSAVGTYTARVTATNSVSTVVATTLVTITTPPPTSTRIFLPLVMRNYAAGPDLIVQSVNVSSSNVQVVIKNQGDQAVSSEFWVDLYVAPNPPPTGVNQIWRDGRSTRGIVWGVTTSALPKLTPGGTLTLTLGDAYYWPSLSNFPPLPPGTPIYVQVDSANTNTTYGGVLEQHELNGSAYNNIFGPTPSTMSVGTSAVAAPVQSEPRPHNLPGRPR